MPANSRWDLIRRLRVNLYTMYKIAIAIRYSLFFLSHQVSTWTRVHSVPFWALSRQARNVYV